MHSGETGFNFVFSHLANVAELNWEWMLEHKTTPMNVAINSASGNVIIEVYWAGSNGDSSSGERYIVFGRSSVSIAEVKMLAMTRLARRFYELVCLRRDNSLHTEMSERI